MCSDLSAKTPGLNQGNLLYSRSTLVEDPNVLQDLRICVTPKLLSTKMRSQIADAQGQPT